LLLTAQKGSCLRSANEKENNVESWRRTAHGAPKFGVCRACTRSQF
jgi:hypothetical protein